MLRKNKKVNASTKTEVYSGPILKANKEYNTFTLAEGQVVEVEFDSQMVVDDIIATQENNTEEIVQDTFNTDSLEEMLEEGVVIDGD